MPTDASARPATPSSLNPSAVSPGYEADPLKLNQHIEATYFNLRIGMAVLAFALPPLLVVGAKLLRDVPLQASMSAYYYAGDGIMRNVFVGALITIGSFLYLYKGFSHSEDWALNLGGLFVTIVALVPMQWQCGNACSRFSVHGTFAVLFFLCIAFVCLFRATDTVSLLPTEAERKRFTLTYRIIGAVMILAPVAAVVVSEFLAKAGETPQPMIFIETSGVWTFAAYWAVKSREMHVTRAERLAFEGRVTRVKRHRRLRPDDAILVATDVSR